MNYYAVIGTVPEEDEHTICFVGQQENALAAADAASRKVREALGKQEVCRLLEKHSNFFVVQDVLESATAIKDARSVKPW